MASDEKSAPWGECAGAACDSPPNMSAGIPAPATCPPPPPRGVLPMTTEEYERIKQNITEQVQKEHYMRPERVPQLPFLGKEAISQYDRITQQTHLNRNLSMTDEDYFVALVGTMDAIKDTVQWVMAQIKVVEMTYKDDPIRQQLHKSVLRNGFMVMVRQANGTIKHGDYL